MTKLQSRYVPLRQKSTFLEGKEESSFFTEIVPQSTQSPDTNIVEAWFLDESVIPDDYDVTKLQSRYVPKARNQSILRLDDSKNQNNPLPQAPEHTNPLVIDNRFKTRYKNNEIVQSPHSKSNETPFIIDSLETNTWLSFFPFQKDSIKRSLKWKFEKEKEVPPFLQREKESLDYSSIDNTKYRWKEKLSSTKPKSFPKRQVDPGFLYYHSGGIKIQANIKGVPIYVDGKYVGETPISKPIQVEPGWHQVSGFSPVYTHLASKKGLQYVGYDSIIQNNESYGSTTVYTEPGKMETVVLKFNRMGDTPKKLSEIAGGVNVAIPMFSFLVGMIFWSM